MEIQVLKFNSLSHAISFAEKNCDRQDGSSVKSSNINLSRYLPMGFDPGFAPFYQEPVPYHPSSTGDEWTDYYGFDEFVDDFRKLRNKKRNDQNLNNEIKKITGILKKYIDQYQSHFIPQNIFDEINDISGDYVDIPRYLDNQPDSMMKFSSQTLKKSINICFQAGGSASSCNEISLIGKIVYCLNNVLKNRTFNLYACHNTNDLIFILVPIILAGTDIITPQIELILLNLKALFRRIFFAIEESLPSHVRKQVGISHSNGAYGRSVLLTKPSIIESFQITPDIIINPDFINTANDIEKNCKKLIKAIVSASVK